MQGGSKSPCYAPDRVVKVDVRSARGSIRTIKHPPNLFVVLRMADSISGRSLPVIAISYMLILQPYHIQDGSLHIAFAVDYVPPTLEYDKAKEKNNLRTNDFPDFFPHFTIMTKI